MLRSSGPGQVLGSSVADRVFAISPVIRLGLRNPNKQTYRDLGEYVFLKSAVSSSLSEEVITLTEGITAGCLV